MIGENGHMRIMHLKTHLGPVAAAQPPSGWRRGLRGAPPDGKGAMLRIGTVWPSTCADSSTLLRASGRACEAGTDDPRELCHLVIDAAQAAAGS